MNDTVLFKEVQRFRQWWLLSGIGLLMAWTIYEILQKGEKSPSVYTTFILLLLPVVLVLIFQMTTQITEEGIFVRMFPLIIGPKLFSWENISKAYTRTYKPLDEYMGWGIKGTKQNRAYNISGNRGLQLELKDGSKVLIGTQRPEEIDEILRQFNKFNRH